jgi:hypothetical protein
MGEEEGPAVTKLLKDAGSRRSASTRISPDFRARSAPKSRKGKTVAPPTDYIPVTLPRNILRNMAAIGMRFTSRIRKK